MAYPAAAQRPLARLVLALGEAHRLVEEAFRDADLLQVFAVWEQFFFESTATFQNTFEFPNRGSIEGDLRAMAGAVDRGALHAAAEGLTRAAVDAAVALDEIGPFDAPPVEVQTALGRVVIDPRDEDTTRDAAALEGVALLVDLGGDDVYDGPVASNRALWMSAAALLDLGGDDAYGPSTPDVADPSVSTEDAYAREHAFTQGFGIGGVAVLHDAAGDDTYAASSYAQGAGVVGVGVLSDRAGRDDYRLAYFGQGSGFLGVGLLDDGGGDDAYGLYTMGMGVGKPLGAGVLLDRGGSDEYLCYHADQPPELPGPSFPNRYGVTVEWAYNDGEEGHYMSVCQGVGWGYRGDWFTPLGNWAGGFGALIDLGDGDDTHTADTMSMGMGFVYGFGFLYDGGGDDRYRSFWWSSGSSAHMGVGLLVDEGGDDDYWVTRASGSWGFDWGVGWFIEGGGDDRYGGHMHYGHAYTYGLTYFLELGGDDVYNAEGSRRDPWFGVVRLAQPGIPLVGAFLDLGGGNDTYVTEREGPGNDATWSHEPVGDNADLELHLGIGIDR